MSKKEYKVFVILQYNKENMPFDPLSVIPGAGSIASAFLQRHWSIKDWHRTNEYNAPKNQVKRLQEAGLPLAAMFSGSGGSTAQQPGNTNVDPTLGAAQGISTAFQNRLQKMEMTMMAEKIREQKAIADLAEGNRDWQLRQTDDFQLPGISTPNQEQLLEIDKQTKNVQRLIGMSTKDLQQLDFKVKEELEKDGTLTKQTRAQLDHMLISIAEADQRIKSNEDFIRWKNKFYESIDKGEFDLQSLLIMLLGRGGIK